MEIWKDVKGHEVYQVSNLGRVRNKNTKNIKKQRLTTWKYMVVTFYVNGSSKQMYVHKLVAEAFIENPENKTQANHINGDKLDNRLENLEWVTPKENIQHAYRIGLKSTETHFKQKGEDHYKSKYSEKLIREVKKMFKENKKPKEINALTGIPTHYLYSIKSGVRWGHVEV